MSRQEDDQQLHTEETQSMTFAGAETRCIERDDSGMEWLDISSLMTLGTSELGVGELLKTESMTLYMALTSMEVMEPRLDMGMLSEEDKQEIAKWDVNRVLSLREVLWITQKLFYCEITWHSSASLLQTLYMCNYFTVQEIPDSVGSARGAENPGRDLVLFPMIFALGACCLQVWKEYLKENIYAEEDVHFGSQPVEFFNQFSHSQVIEMMGTARGYLQEISTTDNVDVREQEAAGVLLEYLEMRVLWLKTLTFLSVDCMIDDPRALNQGTKCLQELRARHSAFQNKPFSDDLAVMVAGCFDPKCMRKYPSMAPVKPRPLLTHVQSHQAFDSLLNDLSLVHPLLQAESVESLVNFFTCFANRQPMPFVRSLMASIFLTNNLVLLRYSPLNFIKRAIREISGPYVWDVLEYMEREPARLATGNTRASQILVQDPLAAVSRIDGFCQEAARNLMDWFRIMCQNAPRQRRICLKYLTSWDVLQGEAEELDSWLYVISSGADNRASEMEAVNPAFNPFWFSSWAYHMKLMMMENALQIGVRLDLYLDYELPMIYGYGAQILQSHFDHLRRMETMLAGKTGQNKQLVREQSRRVEHKWWVGQHVDESTCLRHLSRWLVYVEAQCHLATALWLVSHACERLRLVRAPWARRLQGLSGDALDTCRQQETNENQAVRYALRFRTFSRLNSPTPLTFGGWMTTVGQLDESSASELFAHASRTLGKARMVLDDGCNMLGNMDDGWRSKMQELRYVAVANSVALAKLQNLSEVMQNQALQVSGSLALAHRQILLGAAQPNAGEGSQSTSASEKEAGGCGSAMTAAAQPSFASASVSKSKAKREKKKRRAAKQGQGQGALSKASEWLVATDNLGVSVVWSCCDASPQASNWHQFSFVISDKPASSN
ncbi:N-alpha-acetyltransferase, non-catalitic subunit [Coemansia sp. RSA 486]|nr:N-alpha-acetyltransferase, non-catalitic subunit [Coemansia sp. RSA 486]KAJ2234049.1 N-alpha-acetyltransferase, non-catalitic subunit [Coemansia sp. RSA 485]